MAGNFVKLSMLAHNKRTEAHYAVDLLALGIRKGQEISVDKRVPDGGLLALVHQMQHKGARQMTFTWYPPDGQKTLFQMLKKDTLDFDVTAGLYGDNSQIIAEFTLSVDNVRVGHILYDVPGRPSAQRVEATYNHASDLASAHN